MAVLLLLTTVLIGGCWDYEDLEDEEFPVLATYDLGRDDGKSYDIGIVAPNNNMQAQGQYITDVVTVPTIGMSRETRGRKLTGSYVIGMLQVALCGSELAEAGVEDAIDILHRNPKVKSAVYLAVVKGEAKKVLKVKTSNYTDVGSYTLKLLKGANRRGFIVSTTLHQFIVNSSTPGKNPVVPVIDVGKSSISIAGTAIFKDDRMIAEVDMNDTLPLVLLRGISCRGYIPFAFDDKGKEIRGTCQLANGRSVKVERRGDEFYFTVTVKLGGVITDIKGDHPRLSDKKMVTKVEKAVEGSVQKDCERFIRTMQNRYRVDCIDITKYALAKYRKDLEGKETKVIDKAHIRVKVKVGIDNYGETL